MSPGFQKFAILTFPSPGSATYRKEEPNRLTPSGSAQVWLKKSAAQHLKQEIGFHSFSHVPFGVRGMTRERAHRRVPALRPTRAGAQNSEIIVCVSAEFDWVSSGASRRGFHLLPRRGQTAAPIFERCAQLPGHDLGGFCGKRTLLGRAVLKEGMVSIPGSLLIRYAAGWRKFIPDSSRLRRLRKGLEPRAAGPRVVPCMVSPRKSVCRVAASRKRRRSFSGRTRRHGGEWRRAVCDDGPVSRRVPRQFGRETKAHKLASYTEAERMNSPASGNSQRDRSTISA